jgi:hypothetical protein
MTDQQPIPQIFSVTPYKPDYGFTTGGLLTFLASLAAVGALLGYAAYWVSQFIYFVIAFPAFIGFGIGAVGIRMAKKGHIRNPWIGGLAGFLAGLLAMFAMHYFEFGDFRSHISKASGHFRALADLPEDQLASELAKFENPEMRSDVEEHVALLRIRTFPQFMELQARRGVSISSKGHPINLGYTGSWIYWAVELLIVAGITFGMVFESTAQPYCRKCERWKTTRILGQLRGQPAETASALKSGDLAPIAARQDRDEPRNMRLTVFCCDACAGQNPIDVKLELLTQSKQGQELKTLAHVTYPPDALPALASLFTPTQIEERLRLDNPSTHPQPTPST